MPPEGEEPGATQPGRVVVLDAPEEAPTPVAGGTTPPEERPWDSGRHTDRVRGYIAYWLLALLSGVVICTFISLWAGVKWATLDSFLTAVFTPLITLFGTATGFYFGVHSQQARPPSEGG